MIQQQAETVHSHTHSDPCTVPIASQLQKYSNLQDLQESTGQLQKYRNLQDCWDHCTHYLRLAGRRQMLVFSSLSTVVLLTAQRPMRLSAAHDPFAHQPQHNNQQRHSLPPHTVIIISIIYSSIEKLSKVTHTKYKYKKHRNRTTMDTYRHTHTHTPV